LEAKSQHEATLLQQLHDLQVILEQQSKTQQELTEELDSLRLDSGKSQLTEHIIYLEEQLRKHPLHVEQFQSNSTAVQQMKAQLRELQATVDKKTKDLELFHTTVSSASCSSPSEDVSIREQLDASGCDTPEKDATLCLLSVCHLMSYTICKTSFSTTLEQRKWLSNVYKTWKCSLRGPRRMRRKWLQKDMSYRSVWMNSVIRMTGS